MVNKFYIFTQFVAYDWIQYARGALTGIDGQPLKVKPIKAIGEGATGSVYKVKMLDGDTNFALKQMRANFNEYAEHDNEIEILQRLSRDDGHKNVVKFVGAATAPIYNDWTHKILTELIGGRTLWEVIYKEIFRPDGRRRAQFDKQNLLQVLTQISEGLKHAHSQDIVHHDLKLQNIMLSSDGIIKLIDFGAGKILSGPALSKMNKVKCGSGYYRPPEVGMWYDTGIIVHPDNKKLAFVPKAVDIYACGIVFSELLVKASATDDLKEGTSTHNVIYSKQFNYVSQNNAAMPGSTM